MNKEIVFRIGFTLFFFLFFALLEIIRPKRKLNYKKSMRWFNNLSILIFNNLLSRLLFFLLPFYLANLWEESNYGLFNLISLPFFSGVVLTIILLDYFIYLQHRLFHKVGFLWRLHSMHHTDNDLDVSSALRFHPLEIVLSSIIKSAIVLVLGPPPLSILIFEIILNASAMFNHANIALPLKLDKIIRLVLVTPDMHRVHHSVLRNEGNSNFAFNLPWWDYLFKTYHPQPSLGHEKMEIGIIGFHDVKYQYFPWMIITPFILRKEKNTA